MWVLSRARIIHILSGLIIFIQQRSPTSAHPPLQLRLTAPEEPGFFLQKVPVNSMKEVWGVLEVNGLFSVLGNV